LFIIIITRSTSTELIEVFLFDLQNGYPMDQITEQSAVDCNWG